MALGLSALLLPHAASIEFPSLIPSAISPPDPFAAVTNELPAWFYTDLASTRRQLPERLQEFHPVTFPDGLVRKAGAVILGRCFYTP